MSAGAADAAATGAITTLLAQFGQGNRAVESELAELVYAELRHLASRYMRRERGDHTLQPTALVNEAWARLNVGPPIALQNRAHFYALASNCMRQVLTDHARKRNAGKRGGALQRVTMADNLLRDQANGIDVLVLNEILEHLRVMDARACRIVEMRVFGGLSFEEMAEVLNVSVRTVNRDWAMARAWLHGELSKAK